MFNKSYLILSQLFEVFSLLAHGIIFYTQTCQPFDRNEEDVHDSAIKGGRDDQRNTARKEMGKKYVYKPSWTRRGVLNSILEQVSSKLSRGYN